MPIANRNRVETERLIGFFVNTQVLKADIDGQTTVAQLLQQVKQRALGQGFETGRQRCRQRHVEARAAMALLGRALVIERQFQHRLLDGGDGG